MPLLDRIQRGRIRKPVRLLIHGPGGVGKSTFAAGAPNPLFCDAEKRTEHLDVARLEPESWPEVLAFIGEVLKLESKPAYVVFDTLDHIELLLWSHLTKQHGATSIETVGGGYGKGYLFALEEWRRFVSGLEALRTAGIGVILLAHSQVKTFKNPAGEDYDVWQIKLHAKAAALFKEKVDAQGFASWDDVGFKAKGALKAKAQTTGERRLYFGHNPAFESKAGFDLPDSMSLSWAEFASAVEKFYEVQAA